jgi:hypothetical protein
MKLSKTIDQNSHLQEKLRRSSRVFLYGLIFFTCPYGQVTNNFTCPTDVSTCPGQSEKRYCRGLHLAKQFQRLRFKKINQPETRIAYGSQVC